MTSLVQCHHNFINKRDVDLVSVHSMHMCLVISSLRGSEGYPCIGDKHPSALCIGLSGNRASIRTYQIFDCKSTVISNKY